MCQSSPGRPFRQPLSPPLRPGFEGVKAGKPGGRWAMGAAHGSGGKPLSLLVAASSTVSRSHRAPPHPTPLSSVTAALSAAGDAVAPSPHPPHRHGFSPGLYQPFPYSLLDVGVPEALTPTRPHPDPKCRRERRPTCASGA